MKQLYRTLLKNIAVFSLFVVMNSALASTPETFDGSFLHSISGAETFTVSPKGQQQKYYIYVKLPPGFDKNKKYPAVYLLDGGATFPMLTPIYGQLHFLEDLPDVILVGISYGSANWRKGNNRSHDYTVPSKEREHWGGAQEFSLFLRNELMPLIEKKYPAAPDRRVLFGNSLAGQFGLFNATFQADLFYGIIANNPAIHEVTEQYLVKTVANTGPNKLKLYIALAGDDDERFKKPMVVWKKHWKDKTPSAWQLKIQPMPGYNHFSSIPDTFRAGLKWVLSDG